MAIVEVSLTQSVQLCPGTQNKKSAPMAVYIGAITAGSSCHGPCVSHPVRLALVADQTEYRTQGVSHWSYISDLLLSERQAAAGRQNLIYTTKTLYGEVDIRCR